MSCSLSLIGATRRALHLLMIAGLFTYAGEARALKNPFFEVTDLSGPNC